MPLLLQHPLASVAALAATFALTLAAWQPAVTVGSPARQPAAGTMAYAPTVHAPFAPIVLM